MFPYIGNVIIPIDFHVFRGVAQAPTNDVAVRNAKVLLDIRAMFVGLMMDARCGADGGLFTFHLLQETDP